MVPFPEDPQQGGADDVPGREPVGPRTARPRIRPLPDGPLLVDGPADIVMPDGSVLHCERPVMALCTCRRSLRTPFCDTSHRTRLRRRPRAATARSAGTSEAAGPSATTDSTEGATDAEPNEGVPAS
ncbi:CDGSH iron-sulfur domain-containing protein [Streptomyces sp. NPDC017254]|uniref:CDGSH iron-sulfur domain-containing protein n=1 Tax=unclassified Streptomyces TaxID=2593676 RepID=UPI003798F3C9